LVSGAGPIGLIIGQWCMSKGANAVYYFDIDPRKIEFAKTLGFFEYQGETIHASIEGTGVSPAFARCLEALTAGGRIVLMGNPAREMTLSQKEYWYILRKELTLLGTWNTSYNDLQNDWKAGIAAISDGTLKLNDIITHIFKAEDYTQAFEMMRDKTDFSNKVMIEWNE
jgi:L-iditol 2-dehydrogenase